MIPREKVPCSTGEDSLAVMTPEINGTRDASLEITLKVKHDNATATCVYS